MFLANALFRDVEVDDFISCLSSSTVVSGDVGGNLSKDRKDDAVSVNSNFFDSIDTPSTVSSSALSMVPVKTSHANSVTIDNGMGSSCQLFHHLLIYCLPFVPVVNHLLSSLIIASILLPAFFLLSLSSTLDLLNLLFP